MCRVCDVIMWWLIADETMFGFGLVLFCFVFSFIISYHFSSPCFFLGRVSTLSMILLYLLLIISTVACCPLAQCIEFFASAIVFVCVSFVVCMHLLHSPGTRWYSWRRPESHARVYHFDSAARNIDVENDKNEFKVWSRVWWASEYRDRQITIWIDHQIENESKHIMHSELTTYRSKSDIILDTLRSLRQTLMWFFSWGEHGRVKIVEINDCLPNHINAHFSYVE